MRVLVAEDDEGIAAGLAAALRQHGHAVEAAATVAGAWRLLQAEPFELLLLDLGLADGDGTELLRRVRASPAGRLPDAAMPVLIMTARDEITSRIAGLDLGADDYVIKPFHADELAARMRALRRRAAGRAQPLLRCGELAIDPAARTVLRGGRPVELSAREFAVLLALVEARPRVLSRTQIESQLYTFDGALESNAIEVHVHHLRRKLGEGVIRTMRGVGYFVPSDPAA
ncbi:response regulator transcription factor [Aquincola sp. MAHUQ-54]|uniref:Response regulator transcription factor n=1 Tax=Aquincola agrisoli TaxID=3119538 RepID=A0AAW9QG86_9BURK